MKLAYMMATPDVRSMPLSWIGPPRDIVGRIAAVGYEGVELQVRDPALVDLAEIQACVRQARIEVSAVSTGQVGAEDGLYLTSADAETRRLAIDRFKGVLTMASELGVDASIGRFRGLLGWAPDPTIGWQWFRDALNELSEHAQRLGNRIVLEPQCRFNTDFLNTVGDTLAFLRDYPSDVVSIEGDLFHMSIEERSILGAIVNGVASGRMTYIQLADSNRRAPGWGHLNWVDILDTLRATGYDGWLAMEFVQKPSSEACAQHAYDFVRSILDAPNT